MFRASARAVLHTHERDLVRETQLIVVAPTPGDLASVGREKGGIANQAGAGNVRVGNWRGGPSGPGLSVSGVSPFVPV